MKLIALATALAITGSAAIAQETPAPAPAPVEAAPAAEAAPAPPAPAAAAPSEDPAGGYQPAASPLSAPLQPGQKVVFQASKPPAEAYPAPAPLDKYPVCKKGQYDNCRQRGG